MLTGMNHLTLACSDIGRSFDFYTGLLGFRPAARWADGAYLSIGELWLCLSLDARANEGERADYTHYAFSISQDDFDAFRAKMRNAGVAEWKANTSEGDSFYFLDPDGHRLEAHVGTLESRLAQYRARANLKMQFFDLP